MPGSSEELIVENEHDGLRLDHFLTTVLSGQSRSQVQRLIKEGRVKGHAGTLRASTPVRAGERYVVDFPELKPAVPEAEPLPLRIVFEDPDVVVLDKPAGMVVHPGRRARSRNRGQRAAAPRQGSERDRRRDAPGNRSSPGPRHLRADGRREARSRASGAGAAVSRPRGREGIHCARVGRGAARETDRRADRARSRGIVRRCPRAPVARAARSRG